MGKMVLAVLAALIGLLVGALGGLLGGAHLAGSRDKADADSVRALLDEQAVAWNAGDLDGFMKGYWDDEELTFYSGGDVKKGYKPLQERYRKRYQSDGKGMGKLTFSDLEVRGLGGEWATARGRWKVEKDKETLEGLFTLVLRRFPDGWKIVHDHTSAAEKKG
jgi:uncharacterized protein (TIGR02246 family)